MSWLTKRVAVLLLALWVPATLHCQLESLPGLEFLSCCQHKDAEKTPGHHEQDCANDGCAAVEFGFYKQEQWQGAPAKPSLALVAWPGSLLADESPYDAVLVSCSSPSPPEIPMSWQFLLRAALPVRAPSLAS